MSSPRRNQNSTTDRLSSLPGDLLHHILSFLDFSDLNQTNSLSRRWRYLWTSSPSLCFGPPECFDFESPDIKNPDFFWASDVVSNALLLSTAPHLQTLRISFATLVHLDPWISFAIRRNIQDLRLVSDVDNDASIKINPSLYRCSSLQTLKLQNLDLNLPTSVHLPSLRILHLRLCQLFGNEFQVILSGSPGLEELSLHYCNKHVPVRIHAPSHSKLKHLWIEDEDNVIASESENEIEVSAPSLLSLRLGNYLRCGYYSIKNPRSLVAVSLDFEGLLGCPLRYKDGLDQLVRLLKDVSHVKTLKLCSWCCQILSAREVNHEKPLYFATNFLELKTGLHKWDLLGIAYLLKGSLHLQDILVSIDIKHISPKGLRHIFTKNMNDHKFDESEYWESLGRILSCELQQIKTIKICGFMGSKQMSKTELESMMIDEFIDRVQNEVSLVETFLKSCKGLERMIIRITDRLAYVPKLVLNKVQLSLSRRLLLLPQASPNAKIVFT